jgi:glucan phosphorylase
MNLPDKRIAYFSMEIALDPAMPTYSGGLDILAGDTLRAAAEQNLPMELSNLLHHDDRGLHYTDRVSAGHRRSHKVIASQ